MSGIGRRVKRNIDKKQHKTLGQAWKVTKRIQSKKVAEGPLSDEDKAQFMPNGRMLGRKPTFKEFVDLKMQQLDEAAKSEARAQAQTLVEDTDLDWEDGPNVPSSEELDE